MRRQPVANLRLATSADAPLLEKLGTTTFLEAFGDFYTPDDRAAFLARTRSQAAYAAQLGDPNVSVWLAQFGDAEPVGYIIGGPCKLPLENLEPQAGEIWELYVLADYRKHGLGAQLLSAALEWLASQNRTPLYVGTWSRNLGAQRFYGQFGFEKVGEYRFPVGRQMDRDFILKQRTGAQARVSSSAPKI